jgi:hypothetical protein
MRKRVVLGLLGSVGFVTIAACSVTVTNPGFTVDGGGGSFGSSGSSGGGGSGGSGGGLGSSSGGNFNGDVGEGGTGTTTGDAGFVCAPNPLNYDIPGNGCDDDGDGTVDNIITCDTSIPTGPSKSTATQILNAMEVCHAADATHWGIVSANLTYGHTKTGAGDGNFAYQYGVLQSFGNVLKPQEGSAFGLLSSGTADINDTKDTGPYFKGSKNGMQTSTTGDVPSGFPAAAKGCSIASDVHDVVDLKAQIKVPANAKGLTFDFDFESGEWPDYVCTNFNDSFIAYLTSTAFNSGTPGNISFDSKGNPVSVNVGFFTACSPAGAQTGCAGTSAGTAVCTGGDSQLQGTGFYDEGPWCPLIGGQQSSGGGGTGWLTSTAPVTPGETISIEFIIWDTGDNQYDSSVLLDYLTWVPQEVPAVPVTTPSPPPK